MKCNDSAIVWHCSSGTRTWRTPGSLYTYLLAKLLSVLQYSRNCPTPIPVHKSTLMKGRHNRWKLHRMWPFVVANRSFIHRTRCNPSGTTLFFPLSLPNTNQSFHYPQKQHLVCCKQFDHISFQFFKQGNTGIMFLLLATSKAVVRSKATTTGREYQPLLLRWACLCTIEANGVTAM